MTEIQAILAVLLALTPDQAKGFANIYVTYFECAGIIAKLCTGEATVEATVQDISEAIL